MSLLNELFYFSKEVEKTSDKHIAITSEDRDWERMYRNRWQHDKVVRSTHGVNCTGSCSWKIFVKNGLVTWETQQTDYPPTRVGMPNHEPRGCPRGASYSWYLYSANRVKYPMIRGVLMTAYKKAKARVSDPVKAWEAVVSDPVISKEYKAARGLGGFIRADWDEINEIIAAANIYTIKTYGPDRLAGFSPIPAMSMISYAAGTRYLSLIGGTVLSFYDFYCDLPPSSPQTWGEQTDVPESADWYNSSFLMIWGSNIPVTRTPDAPFYTQVRYKGTKSIVISPDYSDAARFADLWLKPKQGTDAALGMAMGHVILKEFYIKKKIPYFEKYARQYSDLPFLVKIVKKDGRYMSGTLLRASDLEDMNAVEKPQWKPVLLDELSGNYVVPNGTIGSRWEKKQKWNLELKDSKTGADIMPQLSLIEQHDEVINLQFPYFGGSTFKHEHFSASDHDDIIERKVPVKKIKTIQGEIYICTVFDLMIANYGIDRGFDDPNSAMSYDQDLPFTPKWQETITGIPAQHIISTAMQFAENAAATEGKSMIIIGTGVNQWYHTDMIYRSVINMLVLCGCVGQSGGGWSHYVGQEKLRPQTGWLPLAFGLDWNRPPRQMNTTSFLYMHTSQWRYEKLKLKELISPLANKSDWENLSLIDCNVRAERMGWLPSAPQLSKNPLTIAKEAEAAGMTSEDYVVRQLKNGQLNIASEDPDNPANFPRNLFVWRSNLIGSSTKGMEYFMKHLLGAQHSIQGNDLKELGQPLPTEVKWQDKAPEGKLDLLVTLDFRMTTTGLHSDILLPAASWYEKNDLNTTDMHPFIHPFSQAVDPVWESRKDWDIFKGLAEKLSILSKGHLNNETDVVLFPLQHDTPTELSETVDAKDWKNSDLEIKPGINFSKIITLQRNYPETYNRYTSLGPLMKTLGNGGKGIDWNTDSEVDMLALLNTTKNEGETKGLSKIETDIQAAEVILSLAPETNGAVAMKAWKALEEITGRKHTHLALGREEEKMRYHDLLAQPRKVITSPIWSGIDSEEVSYNAGYTNVHELIPWRTFTGRQTLYQDHPWMIAFGENLVTYKPPINTKSIREALSKMDRDDKYLIINILTPHNKWTIHSTWSDNLVMLTLSRGGPVAWMSEIDAASIGLKDNDWIEVFNSNGASVARLIVSQRIPVGALIMYHNQERTVNMPVSQLTGHRGGVHNSVERICLKPTHMIGGYAQLAYSFNYYGTIGSNRDEFVVVRKLKNVVWNDKEITP